MTIYYHSIRSILKGNDCDEDEYGCHKYNEVYEYTVINNVTGKTIVTCNDKDIANSSAEFADAKFVAEFRNTLCYSIRKNMQDFISTYSHDPSDIDVMNRGKKALDGLNDFFVWLHDGRF